MKNFCHFVLLLTFTLLITTYAPCQATDFNYTVTYQGTFQNQRLFQRSEKNPIWLPCPGSPKLISDLNCSTAVVTLHTKGTYTGNLSSSGTCLGTEEAPEYTYGNYLNYLNSQTLQSSQELQE